MVLHTLSMGGGEMAIKSKTKVKSNKVKVKAKTKLKPKVKPIVATVTEYTYDRLSKEEYAKALQHPKWQKKRLKIFERDGWRCKMCKDTETTLCVHHKEYTTTWPWQEPTDHMISLCIRCHRKVHNK